MRIDGSPPSPPTTATETTMTLPAVTVENAELLRFYDTIMKATSPEALFGHADPATHPHEKIRVLDAVHAVYRALSKVAHADRYTEPSDKAVAHEAAVRLNQLWEECQARIDDGLYGTNTPVKPKAHGVIKSKAHVYTIVSVLATGDLSVVYRATNEVGEPVLVKVAKDVSVNDLLANEASTLSKLWKSVGRTNFGEYLPEVIESIDVTMPPANVRRRVNVFRYREGFKTLRDVMSAYPGGVDPRHFVWMFKRVLAALSFVHEKGQVVHGAILPEHVLVHPENHGAMLIDWCASVPIGSTLRVGVASATDQYPQEVLRKLPVKGSVDTYMAAGTMMRILHGSLVARPSLPLPLLRILYACRIPSPHRRSGDAWQLHEQLTEAAHDVYGKPKFIPFTV